MGSATSNPVVNMSLLPAAIVDTFKGRSDAIFGQTGPTGTATSKQLYIDVQTMTRAQLRSRFGVGELYWRIVEWFDGADVANSALVPQLNVIPVAPEGAGVAATTAIAVTGTATGTLTSDLVFSVSVIDEKRFTKEITLATGATADEVAAAIKVELDKIDYAPFTVAVATNTVTITALDVGTVGNYYGIKVVGDVAGVSFAITPWAGGLTDPAVTDLMDSVEGRRLTGASWPEFWNSSISTIIDEFDSRFNVDNKIMDGAVFHGYSATFANAKTEVISRNSQSLVPGGNNKGTNGPEILKPADWAWSHFMAQRDKRLTTAANIADNITTTAGLLDAIGGPALASLPYFNTPLPTVAVTSPQNLFSRIEQTELIAAGYTTFGVNVAGNAMIMGQVVTTYKTDAAGNDNVSFKYLNYVDTASVVREIYFNYFKARFVQSRLTEGDLVAGRSIENEGSIREACARVYRTCADLTLLQKGSAAEKYFSDNLTVSVDLSTGTVTITAKIPIVTQARTFNFPMQLSFSIADDSSGITV